MGGSQVGATQALALSDAPRALHHACSYRTFMTCLYVLFLTGAITNCLKVAIARPRPNWFYQCWPSGNITWQPGSQNAFGVSPPPWPRARTCVARRQRFIAGEVSLDARARRRACRCAPRASP